MVRSSLTNLAGYKAIIILLLLSGAGNKTVILHQALFLRHKVDSPGELPIGERHSCVTVMQ